MPILMSDSLNEKLDLDPAEEGTANTFNRQGQVNVCWDDETILVCEMINAKFLADGNLGSISLLTLGTPLSFVLKGEKIASIDFCDIGYNYAIDKWSSVAVTKTLDSYMLEINLENESE